MRVRTKKATFSLPEEVLQAVDAAVAQGAAPSKNAFVERALTSELREVRRRERLRGWQEAARDPLFNQDVADVESAFSTADVETARKIH